MVASAVLVTGLPGSGKSALLTELLGDGRNGTMRAAVCVHRHARAFGLETTPLTVDTLPCVHYSEVFDFGSGCLCCSPDGDLVRLLSDLCSRQSELKLSHLFIETTGVADPNPFVRVFDNELFAQHFELRSVICVVDLQRVQSILNEPKDAGAPGAGSRGIVQLKCADILVLNHADELRKEFTTESKETRVHEVRDILLQRTGDNEAPSVLGPCSFCKLGQQALSAVFTIPRCRGHSKATSCALPAPSNFMLRFGPGPGHDAACSTACLVRSRGGVCFDAALAMLQLLLDSGQAYRIQGYLSFLPKDLEAASGGDPQVSASTFPPPLRRLWALPMVVVQGLYRGQLSIRAVTSVSAPGSALETAEKSGIPWQETAFDSAAADRGGCKIFICGATLDETALKAQMQHCAQHGFEGPVCNLEEAWPEAARAMDAMEQSVAALIRRGIGPLDVRDSDSSDSRSVAEAFAAGLALALDVAPPSRTKEAELRECRELRCSGRRRPGRRSQVTEAVEVSWKQDTGDISVFAAGSVPVVMQDLMGYGSGLRYCTSSACSPYIPLVVGSEVFCKPA
ncbi:unnamed protein product [Symbiodinium natans]|uniref:CobW/HypB/UreG nucleotide-binding domain-containing protein n=1 Tax=Symbiodinium natans TaxID=878477 RepID=A0A812I0F9_9DINO|nr:unnamed protein product [Symbiodinium natans]